MHCPAVESPKLRIFIPTVHHFQSPNDSVYRELILSIKVILHMTCDLQTSHFQFIQQALHCGSVDIHFKAYYTQAENQLLNKCKGDHTDCSNLLLLKL